MKVKSLLVLIVIVFSTTTKAQVDDKRIFDRAVGILTYTFQYTDVKGTPYLIEDWTNGKLIFEDGSASPLLKLKIDIYNNKFLTLYHDTAIIIKTPFKKAILYPSPEDSLIFANGQNINDKITARDFVQVLAEGKTSLYKYNHKKLEEYSEYNNANKLQRFDETALYFILTGGQYRGVQLNKKSLQEVTGTSWAAVSEFLSKQNLSAKDERGWKAALRYFNTL